MDNLTIVGCSWDCLKDQKSFFWKRGSFIPVAFPQKLGYQYFQQRAFSQRVNAKPVRFFKSMWKLTLSTHISEFCYDIIFKGKICLEILEKIKNTCFFRRVSRKVKGTMIMILRYVKLVKNWKVTYLKTASPSDHICRG